MQVLLAIVAFCLPICATEALPASRELVLRFAPRTHRSLVGRDRLRGREIVTYHLNEGFDVDSGSTTTPPRRGRSLSRPLPYGGDVAMPAHCVAPECRPLATSVSESRAPPRHPARAILAVSPLARNPWRIPRWNRLSMSGPMREALDAVTARFSNRAHGPEKRARAPSRFRAASEGRDPLGIRHRLVTDRVPTSARTCSSAGPARRRQRSSRRRARVGYRPLRNAQQVG